MTDLWMPGAAAHDIGNHAPMDGGPARAVWHITSNSSDHTFANELGWFTGGGRDVAPHLLWDPFTGQLAQLFPADSRSLSLQNAGAVRTNRTGRRCIQIEIVFTQGETVDGKRYNSVADTPCKGLADIMAWLRSLGIADTWPGGAPVAFARDDVSLAVWEAEGGHYGHNQIPGNSHVDPGPMPDLFTSNNSGGGGSSPTPAPTPTVARYQVVINGLPYGYGAHGAHVTTVGQALVRRGFGKHYQSGPGPTWSDADTLNYSDYQKSLGLTGTAPHQAADGVPGESSLKTLLGTLPGTSQPAAQPTVDLSKLVAAARTDPGATQGHQTYPAGVRLVEAALVAEGLLAAQFAGDGSYGTKTRAAYAAWQRRSGVGAPFDGIPGIASLSKLGAKHGFHAAA